MKTLHRLHLMLRSNWISSTGAALMTLAALAFVTILALQATGRADAPYLGIVLLLVLPGIFVFGALLVPLGLLIYRRQMHERMEKLADKPLYFARAVVILTLINLAGLGTVGTASVDYMGSVQFCGTACHSAMEPEYVTYLDSPHCRVDCVHCHVEPTASGFVKSKLNGVKQLIGYLKDDYRRPIPTPVHDLTPAAQTCEKCHWSEKYLGTKLVVRPHFREDEAVSGYTNVLLMRTGGTRPDGESVGIHWHVHPKAVVEYVASDAARTEIPWVRVRQPGKPDRVFAAAGVAHDTPPPGELRKMDCNDCHNRSAHAFEQPSAALDRAISSGLISRELPSIKKYATEALHAEMSRASAPDEIRKHLQQRYATLGQLDEHNRQRLEAAIEAIAGIWSRNIYPERGVGWDTYPDFSGHFGCYRCHDGEHRSPEGATITQKCSQCHVVLSEEEQDPTILETLGLGRGR